MLAGMTAVGLNALIASPDVVAARSQVRIMTASFKQNIPVARVTNLSIPGPVGPIRMRHYRPVMAMENRCWSSITVAARSSATSRRTTTLCRQICREGGLHVLSVDYRLAPEHKAPAGSDDAYAAFVWALDHAGELGADPGRVVVGGDSAGGNLAALVSLRARNEGTRLPALQLLLYPVTNYSGETRSQTLFAEGFFLTKKDLHWCRDQFLDGAQVDAADPRVSPLLADDLSGLPPALVLTAGFDPLRDEGRQYADAMRAAGVTVDYREFGPLVHGFANFFPLGGGSATAVAETISALRAHLAHA